tara:strand:+ start:207 stop:431 length:225 start_codon:yes stop_codon:yes gene_type:complete
MKAKKKAKELVDRFTLYLGTDVNGDECYVDVMEAKQCALICVDEKIETLLPYAGLLDIKKEIEELEEVKQELNK